MEPTYRVLTSIAGATFEFQPGEIVRSGDSNAPGVMKRSLVKRLLDEGTYLEAVAGDPPQPKTKRRSRSATAVQHDAQTEYR